MLDANVAFNAVTAVAVAATAYYTWRNNLVAHATSAKVDDVQGTANVVAAKVDAVQVATDGTSHALAESLRASQAKNEDLIRSLAGAGLLPATPPPSSPHVSPGKGSL
jgi:hypothetical protein